MSAFKISSQNRVPTSPGNAAAAAPSVEPPPSAGGAGFSLAGPQLSGQVAALLAVVAAHDRISPSEFIARAVCARAEEIGIAFLTPPVLTAEGLRTGRRTTGGPQSRPEVAHTHNREPVKGPGGVPLGAPRAPP